MGTPSVNLQSLENASWVMQLHFGSSLFIHAITWMAVQLKSHWDTDMDYRQISNIRHTKSKNLTVSRLAFLLTLPNPLKNSFKSRMKMYLVCRRCSNYIWVIHNFIAQ